MGTFGSRTTPTMNLQLRKVASAARDVLIGLAAKQWNTNPQELIAVDGKVKDYAGERSIGVCGAGQGQQLTQPFRRRSADSRLRMESGGTSGGEGGWN